MVLFQSNYLLEFLNPATYFLSNYPTKLDNKYIYCLWIDTRRLQKPSSNIKSHNGPIMVLANIFLSIISQTSYLDMWKKESLSYHTNFLQYLKSNYLLELKPGDSPSKNWKLLQTLFWNTLVYSCCSCFVFSLHSPRSPA